MSYMRRVSLVLAAAALGLASLPSLAAANATTGVTIRLSGPQTARAGATIELRAVITDNLKYGGGDKDVVLLQRKGSGLRPIASKAISWSLGGSLGRLTVRLRVEPSVRGSACYRLRWTNPGGTTSSNYLMVRID
jgi:hypothetical protein